MVQAAALGSIPIFLKYSMGPAKLEQGAERWCIHVRVVGLNPAGPFQTIVSWNLHNSVLTRKEEFYKYYVRVVEIGRHATLRRLCHYLACRFDPCYGHQSKVNLDTSKPPS